MRTGKGYLVVNIGYHGCHTQCCPFGWTWGRVCHIYTDDHSVFVERSLIFKDVIDPSELEVDFQSNVGNLLIQLRDGPRVELPLLTQDTYSVGPAFDDAYLSQCGCMYLRHCRARRL